jgi:hypothetical protein
MLRFPDEAGSGRLSTSPFVYGQVYPGLLERPEEKGYQSLRPGAEFTDLGRVAMLNGEAADLTRYPARRGFEDLVLLVADDRWPWAWTAVAFPKQRYVWFALKDPHVLRATIFWFSNGGRHYPPWNGRHVNVLGLEEVTSYFHTGLAESAAHNALVSQGYPTCLQLDPAHPTAINYIMACVPVPAGFDHVVAIELAAGGAGVQVQSGGGPSVTVPLDLDFLKGRA